ncbi:MAG: CDP-archaeol synthase [Lachnospiraceae bacterium]|nr:CDP-archaeol synthase [Lachnospiraceae bacterium]
MLILNMYITAFPVILAGILNMVFTKTKIYRKYKFPIDGNILLADGKRLFGENKTWIGFASMILFCMGTQLVWGSILKFSGIDFHNELYHLYENKFPYNLLIGAFLGLAYMLLELPNSFIKRRLDIEPGKTKTTMVGLMFFLIDQIDSMIGVAAVIYIFSEISFMKYLGYIALGGVTHIMVNLILYKLKVRRNL